VTLNVSERVAMRHKHTLKGGADGNTKKQNIKYVKCKLMIQILTNRGWQDRHYHQECCTVDVLVYVSIDDTKIHSRTIHPISASVFV
jgi:hypothetical protein